MRRLHLFQREHAHRQSKGREEDCGRRRTTIEVLGPVKSWAGSLIQCQPESVQRNMGRTHLVIAVSLCILIQDLINLESLNYPV